jgi:signal transduction histidine kinase
MDIRIVARKSAWYVVLIAILTLVIVGVTSFSIFIGQSIPGFPIIAIPLIASIMVVVIGHFVWKRTKDEEVLKSEFVTIVTHKFRTPLTSIKWSAENIISAVDQNEIRKNAEYITKANNELVELTNVLMESSNAESADMNYRLKPVALGAVLQQVVTDAQSILGGRGVNINMNIPANLPLINADPERIRFVIQVMIDNAIAYTPSGKNVTATLSTEKDDVVCTVSDEGMGIAKGDAQHIFTKFYRSEKATGTDTEGVGLGLYMAKTIVEKHGGKIWITSKGEGMGTEVGFRVRKI